MELFQKFITFGDAILPLELIDNYGKTDESSFCKGEANNGSTIPKKGVPERNLLSTITVLFCQYYHRHHYKHWNMQPVKVAGVFRINEGLNSKYKKIPIIFLFKNWKLFSAEVKMDDDCFNTNIPL